jgi:hypothetical protein
MSTFERVFDPSRKEKHWGQLINAYVEPVRNLAHSIEIERLETVAMQSDSAAPANPTLAHSRS